MRLRSIRLRDVGPFRDGLAVEGLSGGLDVLVAANEAGKSTLFRSVEMLFFEKFDTSKAAVLDLAAPGGGSALVEADFEASGGLWRITKSFGRQKKARLAMLSGSGGPAGQEFTGAEAETRLAALAGLENGKPGPLGFLWVGQGGALEPRAPEPKRAEVAALKDIVEREVAELTGAGRLRQLRAAVTDELRIFTTDAKRQPKAGGPWGQAIRRRDEIAAELERARAAVDASEDRRAAITSLTARRAELAAPADVSAAGLAAAEAALAAAEKAVAEAELAERRYEAARTRTAETERAREKALSVLETMAGAARRLADHKAEIARLEPELAAARSAHDARRAELTAAEEHIARLAGEDCRLGEALATARRAHAARTAAERREAVLRRLTEAGALEGRIAGLRLELQHNALTGAAVEALMAAERARVRAADALTASTPRIEIAYEPGADGRILMAGNPVPAGPVVPVDAGSRWPMHLVIPGVGTIVVDTGTATDREALKRAHRSACDDLQGHLATLGVGSLEEARAGHARRLELEREIAEARARSSGLAPGGIDALTAERDALQADAHYASEGAPDLDATSRALAAVEQEIAVAREGLRAVQVAAEAAGIDAAALEARLNAARESATRSGREAEVAAGSHGGPAAYDEARGQLEAATAAANAALREEVALREAVPAPDDRAALIARRDRWKADAGRLSAELRDVDLRLQRQCGEQAGAEQQGTAVDLDRLAGELAEAEAAVARCENEVAGLALLAGLLDEAAAAARERLIEPIVRRLSPYLAEVLPGSEVAIDEDLVVKGLTRGGTIVPVGVLSGGTREQIAVLVRLAYARVLADAGRPTPVILDDALVYSDDARLSAMFAALEKAAAHHQVLVLSCHARWFAGLGGNRVELRPW